MRTIGETLEAFDLLENDEDRFSFMREHYTNAMMNFIKLAYGDNAWTYENREIPSVNIDDAPYGYSDTNLTFELKRMYIFLENSDVGHDRQDEIFIQIAEGLPAFEASLFMNMVQGKSLGVDGLDEFVASNFADLVA